MFVCELESPSALPLGNRKQLTNLHFAMQFAHDSMISAIPNNYFGKCKALLRSMHAGSRH